MPPAACFWNALSRSIERVSAAQYDSQVPDPAHTRSWDKRTLIAHPGDDLGVVQKLLANMVSRAVNCSNITTTSRGRAIRLRNSLPELGQNSLRGNLSIVWYRRQLLLLSKQTAPCSLLCAGSSRCVSSINMSIFRGCLTSHLPTLNLRCQNPASQAASSRVPQSLTAPRDLLHTFRCAP